VPPSPAPLALLLALAAPAASGAEGEWDLAAELGGGQDTNPERVSGSGGPGAAPEGFAAALARARGALEGDRYRLSARLTGAARLYPGRPDASAGAARLEADARRGIAGPLGSAAELDASGLSERGHRLDQRMLRARAGLRWDPGSWSASLAGGWALFEPLGAELRPFRASGPEAWLRSSWAPAQRHVLSAGLGLWSAGYPGWPAVAQARRRDDTFTATAEYAWRGPLLAALSYAWSSNRSTAPGGAFERHRVTARGAALLPLDLSLALQASLQWTRYPEPLFLSQQLLAGGGESQNAVDARLVRRLGGSFELALSFARYWNEAVSGGTAPSFGRSVTSLALGWRGSSGDR
jgi:hypothetical protein